MRIILFFFTLIAFFSSFSQSRITETKQIAPHIYVVWLDQYENKSLIAEFDKYLVLVEFPQNDSVSKDLIGNALAMFPKKPIKYVLHSHHHAHSISTFDPFLQLTEATLITTKYNYEEVKNKTKDTFSLKNRTIIYDSAYTIKDKNNEIKLYEILQSKYAVPTKEYNIFYFPSQQLLVSGCLFNKPISYFEVVNARKPALKKFITDNQLGAKILIPTNTSRASGFVDICSIEMLDTALIKGINPYQFMDNFQSKTIYYLESRSDSLVSEFKKIPRSFDYLVCANGLRSIKKDYNRAIIIYKTLLAIYPKEVDLYFNIAECYESKGAKIEALAFYNIFLSITTNEDDKKETKEKIESLSR
jgi:tetratricopeptide (TPR) repeat protein